MHSKIAFPGYATDSKKMAYFKALTLVYWLGYVCAVLGKHGSNKRREIAVMRRQQAMQDEADVSAEMAHAQANTCLLLIQGLLCG